MFIAKNLIEGEFPDQIDRIHSVDHRSDIYVKHGISPLVSTRRYKTFYDQFADPTQAEEALEALLAGHMRASRNGRNVTVRCESEHK